MRTLAHLDTPPCPECGVQAVVPGGGNRLICVLCGIDWEEADPAIVARAEAANRAWRKYEAEAERNKTREKSQPRRTGTKWKGSDAEE